MSALRVSSLAFAFALVLAPLTACDGLFGHGDQGDGGRGRHDDHHGHGGGGGGCMQSHDAVSGGADAFSSDDAGTRPPPVDHSEDDASVADDTSEPADTAPPLDPCDSDGRCVTGYLCGDDALCHACDGGVCPCQDAADCAAGEVCDAESGACRPPTCAEIGAEAECLARAECKPVYSGVGCVDAQGGECTSADTECTCESYAFAVCVDR
ncbi:MAG: hypothetical protein KC635_04020 [Myxococcales bacterium]|nr:hypothetical protein [Myxococcales bacterium]MCB9733059.1 hypothetical protein [Deltaproteobacteria bacterium]